MAGTQDVRQGMQVFSSDEHLIGTIDRVDQSALLVGGRRIDTSRIARVANNKVYIKGVHDELGNITTDAAQEGTIRVPVYEERLDVDKQQAEIGEVRVHKTVESEEVTIPVELRREHVEVHEHAVADRPVDAATLGEAFQERTIRVPVRGEEAIVEKQAYVTGEVEITKEQRVEQQQVTDTVRRERVNIDDDYKKIASEFQQSWLKRAGSATSKRTWEQTEPYYRWGFESAYDKRYTGRSFEQAEADLRTDYQTRFGKQGDSWEELREDIREAYNRVRR
jgi:uncharacterized protein (TIGR02271 family)